jgi:hypothetical protein
MLSLGSFQITEINARNLLGEQAQEHPSEFQILSYHLDRKWVTTFSLLNRNSKTIANP